MALLNMFCTFCAHFVLWLCGLNHIVEENKSERADVLRAEEAAYWQLSVGNRILLWFADGNIAQCRAARRKYWKVMDHRPWARLFKAQRIELVQLQSIMTIDWKMPGYFQKRVLAEMQRM